MNHADNYQITKTMKTGRYMPGLDGLRALAVLAVIAYHLDLKWAPGGLLGVCLFFVLSGYLITDLLLTEWELSGHIDMKDFWLRRARRLLPALLVMLAGVVSWIAAFGPARLATLWGDILASVFYTSNWWLIFHKVSYFAAFGPPSPLGHLWSLAIEEQFYLVWPMLLWLGLRYLPKRKFMVAVTLALALISALAMAFIYEPGLDPSRVYYGTDTRAFALLIGAALALVWPSRNLSAEISGKARFTLDLTAGAGLLIIVLLIVKSNEYQPFLYRGGLLLFSLAAAVVVGVFAHPASRLGRIFGLKPFRWLGVWSYGIYLWHYPVIVLTSPAVNTGGVDITRALGQVGANVLLAVLSWFIIEKPIRYGQWNKMGHSVSRPAQPKTAIISGRAINGETIRSKTISGKVTMITITLLFSVSFLAAAVYGCTWISQVQENSVNTRAARSVEQPSTAKAKPGNAENMGKDENAKSAENTKNMSNMANLKNVETANVETAGKDIMAIGDSVMLDVEPVLKKLLPGIVVQAKVGRQMYQAPSVIANIKEQGTLRTTVIVELGTNGSFTAKQLKETLDSLGTADQIILINTRVPRSWESEVNRTLSEVAAGYPKTKIVDWYKASSGYDGYFGPDGVHLSPKGVEAYSELVFKAVNPDTP